MLRKTLRLVPSRRSRSIAQPGGQQVGAGPEGLSPEGRREVDFRSWRSRGSKILGVRVHRWAAVRLASVGLAGVALALAYVSSASAAPGDLDPSFGSGGKVTTVFGPGSNGGFGVAIQADGKIVAVGRSGSGGFAVARYNADGSLDASFGSGGKVTTVFGVFDVAFAVAIQGDGKIVAVGATAPGGFCCQFALARYNVEGSLDASFGSGGEVTTAFGGDSEARALAIQADGKIVVVGSKFDPFSPGLAIARYNTDGSLDTSFGAGGEVTTNFGGFADSANAVALQSDGKIVVSGGGGPSNDFALARLNADGSLDNSFGANGKVTTDFGASDRANGVAIQGDGKIVAAGSGGFFTRFALARYNTDGSLDTSFNGTGKVTTVFTGQNVEQANALAIQANGKIVAVGRAFMNFDGNFALARYNTDGSLDAGFGTGGEVMTSFGDRSSDDAQAVALQTDGKIVVVGGGGPCTPSCQFELARYTGGTVADTTAPTITVPAAITTDATSPAGAIVTYSVTATDPDDAVASLSCAPVSGSVFPIGTTTVTCTASDTNGNTSTASFIVHVEGASEQLTDLLAAVTGVGPGTSLTDKVRQVQSYVAANDLSDACSTLIAFINEVRAESGKTIPFSQAATLTASAQRIMAVLGC
jgi:uncharacterized delta-60 repeat protein